MMEEQGQILRGEGSGQFPFEAFRADARQWLEQHDVRTVNAMLDERYGPVLLDALLQAGAGEPLRPSRDRSFTGKRDTAVRIPFNLGTNEFWGGAKLHHQENNADGVPVGLSFTLGLPHGNGPEIARQGFQDDSAFVAYLEALFAPLPLTQPPLLESHGSLGRQTPLIPARRAEVEDKLRRYRSAWGQSRKLQVYVILTPEELESGAFPNHLQAAVSWCAGLVEALQRVTAVGAENLGVARLSSGSIEYELTSGGMRAVGVRVGETFVVRAGSTARAQVVPSFETHNYAKLRASLIEEGRLTLQPDGEVLVFQQDVPFDSASAAAAVILGRAANGLKEWKEPGTNRTLRDSLAGVLPSEWLQAPTFEWIPFFEALARRLLDFESAEGQLELLRVLRAAGVNINHDEDEELSELDPFTFFSLILKSKSDARVNGFLKVIQRELDVQVPVPTSFEGVPWSEPRSAWFFGYRSLRRPSDIPTLWRLAQQAVSGQLTAEVFSAALGIYMVGIPRLTQGLFWLSPHRNLPLNGINVPYLNELGITGAERVKSLPDYQAVLQQAAGLGQPFPELSHAAWVRAQERTTTIRPVDSSEVEELLFTPPADVPLNQILYGPPGTGKTYAVIEEALRILSPAFLVAHNEPHQRDARKAEYDRLAQAGAITFVTFHQSFTYEDFIEGLKPQVTNGQIVFREEAGIFLEAVRQAGGRVREGDPEQLPRAHVLVIDEINRGNVAKIFGELLTLLEDTKRAGASDALSVRLSVSRFELTVPPSLYVIGTMNTADRSLTQLDAALRRRFTFKSIWPDASLLPEHLALDGGQLNLRRFLGAINDRLEERLTRDQLIGHAYLLNLPARLDTVAGALRNRILPLLEEFFFEDWPSIREVLGDDQKSDAADQFIHVVGEGERRRYRYNEGAFKRLSAFTGVYDPA